MGNALGCEKGKWMKKLYSLKIQSQQLALGFLKEQKFYIVDLDGAVEGKPMNQEIIFSIISEFPEERIQIGGGIRSFESASEYLKAGIERVIMGTSAVEEPDMLKDFCVKYPNRLVLGIDALDGVVKTQGWLKGSGISPAELVKKFEDDPIAAIIFTDISKGWNDDRTQYRGYIGLSGPGKNSCNCFWRCFISRSYYQLEDKKNISGVICGRALYEKLLLIPMYSRY